MTDSPPHGQLTELEIGDDAEAWVAAGFAVQGDAVRLGDVTLRLVGGDADRGILGWSLPGVSTAVDGLPPVAAAHLAVEPAEHPNGVTSIDHLVVETDDFGRTIPELEAAGLELRRTRTFDLGDGERQQCFFWMGSVILELVGMVAPAPQAATQTAPLQQQPATAQTGAWGHSTKNIIGVDLLQEEYTGTANIRYNESVNSTAGSSENTRLRAMWQKLFAFMMRSQLHQRGIFQYNNIHAYNGISTTICKLIDTESNDCVTEKSAGAMYEHSCGGGSSDGCDERRGWICHD